jgi:hypothetical protein
MSVRILPSVVRLLHFLRLLLCRLLPTTAVRYNFHEFSRECIAKGICTSRREATLRAEWRVISAELRQKGPGT